MDLSELEGYKAATKFLEYYWKAMNSDDMTVALSAMQLIDEDRSIDPAARNVWRESVRVVVEEREQPSTVK